MDCIRTIRQALDGHGAIRRRASAKSPRWAGGRADGVMAERSRRPETPPLAVTVRAAAAGRCFRPAPMPQGHRGAPGQIWHGQAGLGTVGSLQPDRHGAAVHQPCHPICSVATLRSETSLGPRLVTRKTASTPCREKTKKSRTKLTGSLDIVTLADVLSKLDLAKGLRQGVRFHRFQVLPATETGQSVYRSTR